MATARFRSSSSATGAPALAIERAQVQRWRYTEQSRWLVRKGYVVIVPTRRGYGGTGGADVENNYNCANPWYAEALAGGVASVLSAIDYAKAQPFIDAKRFILIGQSVGGFVTVGVTAAAPPGLLAAVNFGGRPWRRSAASSGEPVRAGEVAGGLFRGRQDRARAHAVGLYGERPVFRAGLCACLGIRDIPQQRAGAPS